MEKRKWNDSDNVEVSLLGFGCMRFPLLEDGRINEAKAQRMLDRAIKGGVNYIDTAYPYHDGESEPFLGRCLQKYERDSYYLATKLPMWQVNSVGDAERIFEDQLRRLHTDHIDFYLLHALNREKWEALKEQGILEYCEKLQQEGRIRFFGFSFHDSYEVFEEILTYRKWDFCQIQFNYMDTQEQAGLRGYELTEKLGVPLIVMEPVRGGSLAGFSEDIDQRFHALDDKASIASFALRYVGSFPNVKVVLSGMSTMEQVEDNLHTFSPFFALHEKERQTIEELVAFLKGRVQNGCTGCRYCMPCPAGVNIPGCFQVWNQYHIYRSYPVVKWGWENMPEQERPENCIQCGKCEAVCPQQLSIREDLKRVSADLMGKVWDS